MGDSTYGIDSCEVLTVIDCNHQCLSPWTCPVPFSSYSHNLCDCWGIPWGWRHLVRWGTLEVYELKTNAGYTKGIVQWHAKILVLSLARDYHASVSFHLDSFPSLVTDTAVLSQAVCLAGGGCIALYRKIHLLFSTVRSSFSYPNFLRTAL